MKLGDFRKISNLAGHWTQSSAQSFLISPFCSEYSVWDCSSNLLLSALKAVENSSVIYKDHNIHGIVIYLIVLDGNQ